MGRFRDLKVWQLGMSIVKDVHDLTAEFPRTGHAELKSQIKRSAISIPSNIAEGANRGSAGDFKRFLGIALGSCGELETQVEMVKMLGIGNRERIAMVDRNVVHEGKMLRRLIQVL